MHMAPYRQLNACMIQDHTAGVQTNNMHFYDMQLYVTIQHLLGNQNYGLIVLNRFVFFKFNIIIILVGTIKKGTSSSCLIIYILFGIYS